jgi:hypothetical protein
MSAAWGSMAGKESLTYGRRMTLAWGAISVAALALVFYMAYYRINLFQLF